MTLLHRFTVGFLEGLVRDCVDCFFPIDRGQFGSHSWLFGDKRWFVCN